MKYMIYPPIIPPIPDNNNAAMPNTNNFKTLDLKAIWRHITHQAIHPT